MEKVIDRLFGCLTEGDALTDLEQEHRAEVLADERLVLVRRLPH